MLALEPTTQIASATKSSWPHLDAKTVLSRLDLLMKNPNRVYQGALGLCGEATFFRHVIQRDPIAFYAMGNALFLNGKCLLGELYIDPDSDLLEADYPQIVTKRGVLRPPIPPQADWMVLSALRDSENGLWDFEGNPEENKALGSRFSELEDWYGACGQYVDVEADTDTDLAHVKATIQKTANNHIALVIKTAMIRDGRTGEHVISLEDPITFRTDKDLVEFRYWTWGLNPYHIKSYAKLTYAKFAATYLGAVIATF